MYTLLTILFTLYFTHYTHYTLYIDQRVFVTFNPFNVYVTQADAKPGCVLRPANVVPLLQQGSMIYNVYI